MGRLSSRSHSEGPHPDGRGLTCAPIEKSGVVFSLEPSLRDAAIADEANGHEVGRRGEGAPCPITNPGEQRGTVVRAVKHFNIIVVTAAFKPAETQHTVLASLLTRI